MEKKRKPISPQAAKILEQYRNAGKPPQAVDEDGAALPDANNAAPRQAAPPPAMPRRSGTRGK